MQGRRVVLLKVLLKLHEFYDLAHLWVSLPLAIVAWINLTIKLYVEQNIYTLIYLYRFERQMWQAFCY